MISWQGDDEPAPTPEQLAAYADGELDGCPQAEALRCRIESWLAHHPEAAADFQTQRALARLWQSTTPPEPSESAWGDVLARLEQIPFTPPRPVRLRTLAAWTAVVLGAGAAAVWMVLALARPEGERQVVRQGQPGPAPRAPEVKAEPAPEPVEAFPVATADEIEILRMPGADTEALVVGEPPLQGPMLLVAAGEVEVMQVKPEVRMGGAGPPMVWTPLDRERVEP